MLSDAVEEDQKLLGILLVTANKIAKKLSIEDNFRLVINNGAKSRAIGFSFTFALIVWETF